MGFLVKKAAPQTILAKVFLSNADLLTPGFIVNIPEYPAVVGYFWSVLYMNGEIIQDVGLLPYVGTSSVHIQAEDAINHQYRFGGGFLGNMIGWWSAATLGTGNSMYYVNSQLQIHNPGNLTVGTSGLNLYIAAILQKR
jgi:hypothetical protein